MSKFLVLLYYDHITWFVWCKFFSVCWDCFYGLVIFGFYKCWTLLTKEHSILEGRSLYTSVSLKLLIVLFKSSVSLLMFFLTSWNIFCPMIHSLTLFRVLMEFQLLRSLFVKILPKISASLYLPLLLFSLILLFPCDIY